MLTVALLASACDSPPVGPFSGGTPGTQCAPAGGPEAIGVWVLRGLHDDQHAKVTSVELPHVHHLRVLGVWLVPLDGTGGIGDAAYPPASWPAWHDRVPAVGGIVGAGPIHGQDLLYGLALTAGSKFGTAGGPIVTYSFDGNSYTVHEAITVRIGDCAAIGL
jgi:hypothetical protein